jgi:hypothetical protein
LRRRRDAAGVKVVRACRIMGACRNWCLR